MAHAVDSLKTYFVIFFALMILTAITVAAAYIDFGRFSVIIALGIATLKASLVLWFFMHVRHGNPLLKIFVAAGFVWLAILMAFTFQDYLTRPWQDNFPESKAWVTDDATHFKPRPPRASAHH
jgi:cytochrome c oxidase subunit IV